jgi:hypothetical protein
VRRLLEPVVDLLVAICLWLVETFRLVKRLVKEKIVEVLDRLNELLTDDEGPGTDEEPEDAGPMPVKE